MATKAKQAEAKITITPPNFKTISIELVGTSPYLQCRFSKKAQDKIAATQAQGQKARKGAKKEPRNFDEDYEGAFHRSTDGWIGVPAAALRNACIDVCRMVGYKMTMAKMSIFIEADGFDVIDGQPLIKLQAKKPERTDMMVRNATGVVDIRVRPMWREWSLKVRARFDADQFDAKDVVNLLHRAGQQVGIGEGRPFSKSSNGMGYGLFTVKAG